MEHEVILLNKWLYDYAKFVIDKHNMDDSHGIEHFFNVRKYAQIILSTNEVASKILIEGSDIPRDRIENIVLDAAFCHDLIDSKYTNEETAVQELSIFLISKGYTQQEVNILIYIIKNISYSKRIKRIRSGLLPFEDGPLKVVTQIVCDADQFDGYDVNRCILYQTLKYKDLQEPEKSKLTWGWIRTIIEKRLLLYKDNFMNFEISKLLAVPLHNKLEKYLKDNLLDAEIYEY